MVDYSLALTAIRIRSGTDPVIAIKEHADAWNQQHALELFTEEPVLIEGQLLQSKCASTRLAASRAVSGSAGPWLDAWLAGAAEYEAFLIDAVTPDWALQEGRFLKRPHIVGGANGRRYGLMETPFAWRRRMIFGGRTMLR